MAKAMGKREIVDKLSKKVGLTKAMSGKTVNALVDIFSDALAHGRNVNLIGFGSIKVNHRAARMGRNPQTGKQLKIAARNVASFHSGATLKRTINK